MQSEVSVHGLSFRPLISEEEIRQKVVEMGASITEAYRERNPIFLGILNGCFVFMADLVRACDLPCEVSFIKLASYEGLQSTGEVKTHIGLEADIKDRHVILVEDIIDTGKTLHSFLPVLAAFKPASISLAALIVKPEAIVYPIDIAYKGFDIENKFIVGYGLDYDGHARNLKGIYQLSMETP